MSTWPLDPQFTDGESLDHVLLDARITDKLNELRTLIPDPQLLQLGRDIAWTTGDDTDIWINYYNESVLFSAGDLIDNPGAGVLSTTVSGLWRWSAEVVWDACGSGVPDHRRVVKIRKNGTEPAHKPGTSTLLFPAGAWPTIAQDAGGVVVMVAGDTLQLGIRQNTGGSLDATAIIFALERIA